MQELVTAFLDDNQVIAPVLFVLLRAVPIIIPPVPGIAADLIGLAVFPWIPAYFLGGVGVMLGAMSAFYIARYFREPLVAKFASLRAVEAWEARYSEKKKFWSLVALRLATGPFFDYISYAAGLTKMRASVFFWSTFLAAAPYGLVVYYFGGISKSAGIVTFLAFAVGVVALGLVARGIVKTKQTSNTSQSSNE